MLGLGIMSGSSLDGLDLALVEFDIGPQIVWQFQHGQTYPIESHLAEKLRLATQMNAFEYAELEFEYSKYVAKTILEFTSEFNNKMDYIALHGHTVVHLPKFKKSLQLINAAYVAEQCQSVTISDFRNNDLALGGQGTPMAVIADRYLFPDYNYYLNLGGIANISYFDNQWNAYDLFPFNQVLNHFAQKLGHEFDRNGVLAEEGVIDLELIESLKSHNYISMDFPKSLDNTQVKNEWINWLEDLKLDPRSILKTFTEFTCLILDNVIEPNSKIMITGGGTKNTYFIQRLQSYLSKKPTSLYIPEEKLIDYKEAMLMAFAGALRLKKLPNFLSSATGSTKDTIGGAVYLPADERR